MRRFVVLFAVVANLVLADAVTKELAAGYLKGSAAFPVIGDYLAFAYVENRGCAWGLFQGQVWALAAFAVLALAFFIWKRRAIFSPGRLAAVAEPLLYAGLIGNLIDRVVRGYVIDFIDCHWHAAYHFPCFNLADSLICIAAALLILAGFLPRRSREKAVS